MVLSLAMTSTQRHRDHHRSPSSALAWLALPDRQHPQGRSPRSGAEIELAPNRKPYYDDEELEGPSLDRALLLGLLLLVVIARRPAAVLADRARPAGGRHRGFEQALRQLGRAATSPPPPRAGSTAPAATAAEGVGGAAAYTLTDPTHGPGAHGERGRPPRSTPCMLQASPRRRCGTSSSTAGPSRPMPPWGVAGGGPMNDQQINNLIAYLKSIQTRRRSEAPGAGGHRPARGGRGHTPPPTPDKTDGEALFNLEMASAAPTAAPAATPRAGPTASPRAGGGAMGPNLTGGWSQPPVPQRRRPRRLRRRPGPRTASGTGSRARAAARCPASARCSPRSRSRPSSSTSGGCDHDRQRLDRCAFGVGARDPRHHHRRSSPFLSCAAASTCCWPPTSGARLGLLVALAGLAGWMASWAASGGSTASACGARPDLAAGGGRVGDIERPASTTAHDLAVADSCRSAL